VKSIRLHMRLVGIAAAVSCSTVLPLRVMADVDANAPMSTGIDKGLVNITTPAILAPREMALGVDVRVFGDKENATYFGPSLRIGASPNWEFGVNSALAQFKRYTTSAGTTISYGGTDVELTAKYATRQSGKYALSYQFGLGMPHTPSQVSPVMTAGIAGSYSPCSYLDLYINPRTSLITDNAIVGLGVGAKLKLAKGFSLIGDYTAIIGGANTIALSTGTPRSHDVYGAALRYTPGKGQFSIDLGYSNGIGSTTGSSLTPGLGNDGAFYLSLNMRR